VLELIEQDNLMANAASTGNYVMNALRGHPKVKEIRGKGLMIGIELFEPCEETRKKLIFDHHIFTGSSSNKYTFRLLPALNLTVEDADIFLEAFDKMTR